MTFSWNGEPEVREKRRIEVLDAAAVALLDPERTLVVGLDPGRVNPLMMAWEARPCPERSTEYEHLGVTRKHYYKATLIDECNEWHRRRRVGDPRLRAAYTEMSEHAWKTCSVDELEAMVAVCTTHEEVLSAERESKEASLWSMRCWRRKTAYKDRVASQMLTRWQQAAGDIAGAPGPKPAVVLAFGNAGFSPTGRGEKSVPTKAWVLAFVHAFKRMRAPGGVLMTSEYFTTLMCHRCECLGEEMRDGDGRVLRNIRYCRSAICAANQNNCTVRNRDRNAAISIGKAGKAFVRAEDRPHYLTKEGKHGHGRCPHHPVVADPPA